METDKIVHIITIPTINKKKTPPGDGNITMSTTFLYFFYSINKKKTPTGDGNFNYVFPSRFIN